MNSIHEIDLSPVPGKKYWTGANREWREEFIYFLLVDRFHDERSRTSSDIQGRQKGFGNAEQLQGFCGGTINGITMHLDYIHDLGCTAIWLSPVFENNKHAYHGYAIENYLNIDPRFGSNKTLPDSWKEPMSLISEYFWMWSCIIRVTTGLIREIWITTITKAQFSLFRPGGRPRFLYP